MAEKPFSLPNEEVFISTRTSITELFIELLNLYGTYLNANLANITTEHVDQIRIVEDSFQSILDNFDYDLFNEAIKNHSSTKTIHLFEIPNHEKTH